jgi:hypothetical protein
MSLNRTRACAALGLLVLLATTPSFGEGPEGMQLFAPADVSTFGGAQQPNDGYFFQFDVLYWSISRPDTTPIGKAGLTRLVDYGPSQEFAGWQVTESNTLNTADFQTKFSVGNRFDFGHVREDGNGWLASIWQLRDQGNDYHYAQADVVFLDVPFGSGQLLLNGPVGTDAQGIVIMGNLPVVFYNIMLTHWSDQWGGELMYLHRLLTCHEGSTVELFAGARYLEFNDGFRFLAGDATTTPTFPSFLADSTWQVAAENHIIGPQVGLRWFKKQGRWTLNTEGRFMAGFNLQNIHEVINLGPNLNPGNLTVTSEPSHVAYLHPTVMGPTQATYDAFASEFSPALELRLDARYQITRYLNFHVGWTGFWTNSIARGDALVDYTVDGGTGKMMGIDMTNNRENLFINGLTLGFDFNR